MERLEEIGSERIANELTLRYYETTSSVFDTNPDYSVYASGMIRCLGDWLDVIDKDAVDLGCGNGQLCWTLKSIGAKSVTGVNACEDEVELARSRVFTDFSRGDILEYLQRSRTNSIDRIYALNVFEHFEKEYLINVLKECLRVLRDGGTVTAIVPNATSPYGGMTRYWDFTHELAFTPSSIRQLKTLCGFSNVEFRELGPKPHGVTSLARYILWNMVRVSIMFRLLIETASVKGGIYTADLGFCLKK